MLWLATCTATVFKKISCSRSKSGDMILQFITVVPDAQSYNRNNANSIFNNKKQLFIWPWILLVSKPIKEY